MGLVVIVVLLFLVIAFVIVVFIKRRTIAKVEISGGKLHEYAIYCHNRFCYYLQSLSYLNFETKCSVFFSECNVASGECEYSADRETYTVSSDKPMPGVGNPTYDCMDWGNQPRPAGGGLTKHNGFSNSQPAPYEQFVPTKAAFFNHRSTNTTDEKVREDSFERVVDNDLYSLGSPAEGAKTMGSGEQVQISSEYDYVAWGTTHQ